MLRYLLSHILILFSIIAVCYPFYPNYRFNYKKCLNKQCNLRCAYGLIYDSQGCQQCQCIPKAEKCPSKRLCNIRCLGDPIFNDQGCQMCQCYTPLKKYRKSITIVDEMS
ncbi:unnamed protein product [Gordionus sp. m RMFG-2023]